MSTIAGPADIRRLIAEELAAHTGHPVDVLLDATNLDAVPGVNSIVLADAVDAVEDQTGLLADADRLTKHAFTSVANLAETFL